MGEPRNPEAAILFAAALFSRDQSLREARELLGDRFGEIFLESSPLPWDYTDYYSDELGVHLQRVFFFFKGIIDPSCLPEAKLATHEMERRTSDGGRRCINLDPGYLSLGKVVLASTKNHSHRVYLGRGIYGQVMLFFKDGSFHPFPFTFGDYRALEVQEVFLQARAALRKLLGSLSADPSG